MERYVGKMKLALNMFIENMLSKKENIKLISGYDLLISKVTEVSVIEFTELKLLDFIGGRKFEVDGEGRFSIVDERAESQTKHVAFRVKNSVVTFNDSTQTFDVVNIGDFTVLDFVK